MSKIYSRYLLVLLGLTLLLGAPLAVLNLVVDPFLMYRPFAWTKLDGYKDSIMTRTAKAELIRGKPVDAVILGSSRAEIGIDPLHPAWQGGSVFNLGLTATNIYETRRVLEYVLSVAKPKTVLLCVDFSNFNELRTTSRDFDRSRFNPERQGIQSFVESLLSTYTTFQSLKVLDAYRKGKASRYTTRGHRVSEGPGDIEPYDAVAASLHFAIHGPGGYLHEFKYTGARMLDFKTMLQRCRESDVTVKVVVLPVHAVYLETIGVVGYFDEYQHWLRDLVAVITEDAEQHPNTDPIPLWDYSGFGSIAAESVPADGEVTSMQYFHEASHCKKGVGDLILDQIFDWTGPGKNETFGVNLDAGNVDEHIRRLRYGHVEYADSHPEEIKLVMETVELLRQ